MTKIAYILEGLYNSAGMERVLTIRANALCANFDITIITLDDGSKPDYFPLDHRIRRIFLNTKDNNLKQKISDVLYTNKYDIVTSMGGKEFYCLYQINDGSKKFFEFHFSFDISKVWMGHIKNPILRWLAVKGQTLKRIKIARQYDKIIVLCKADKRKWERYCKNVEFIYNPLTIQNPIQSNCTSKNVIAVGRLNYQKGFDYLIDSWCLVYKKHPDWKLNIYGEGNLRDDLQKQIDSLKLSNVVTLRGRTNDIAGKYAESSIFVLSSRDEAFGLVIVEAEACGLPIVSFDCPSAPAELINNGVNGYIIDKVGDVINLSQKICTLIESPQKRIDMGKKSIEMAEFYNMDRLADKWKRIYEMAI